MRSLSRPVTTLNELATLGMAPAMLRGLREISMRLSLDERAVVSAFIEILLEVAQASAEDIHAVRALSSSGSSVYAGRDARNLRREIRQAVF
jgi:hypothetical protein